MLKKISKVASKCLPKITNQPNIPIKHSRIRQTMKFANFPKEQYNCIEAYVALIQGIKYVILENLSSTAKIESHH